MRIENKVILNGQIRGIRAVTDHDGMIVRFVIGLHVIRRPQSKPGNEKGDIRSDMILVQVHDSMMVQSLLEQKAAAGDMLEAVGVLRIMHGKRTYLCGECGAGNTYEGTKYYVHPFCIRLTQLHPKRQETVRLTARERRKSRDEIMKILERRKKLPGEIIGIRELKEKSDGKTFTVSFIMSTVLPSGDSVPGIDFGTITQDASEPAGEDSALDTHASGRPSLDQRREASNGVLNEAKGPTGNS